MRYPLRDCGCNPTAYSGGSTLLVHNPECPKYPERPLTREELIEWKAKVKAIATLHPVMARRPEVERLYEPPRPPDVWHTCGPTCGCEESLKGDGIPVAKHKRSRRPKAGI